MGARDGERGCERDSQRDGQRDGERGGERDSERDWGEGDAEGLNSPFRPRSAHPSRQSHQSHQSQQPFRQRSAQPSQAFLCAHMFPKPMRALDCRALCHADPLFPPRPVPCTLPCRSAHLPEPSDLHSTLHSCIPADFLEPSASHLVPEPPLAYPTCVTLTLAWGAGGGGAQNWTRAGGRWSQSSEASPKARGGLRSNRLQR